MSLDIIQFVVNIQNSDFKYISRYHKMHAIKSNQPLNQQVTHSVTSNKKINAKHTQHLNGCFTFRFCC